MHPKSRRYRISRGCNGEHHLQCCLRIGHKLELASHGFVINHVSKVFGPAPLCFNEVSYLITTAQDYSKIIAGLADLFERVMDFLSRFEVYARMRTVDIHLRKIIFELPGSFLGICGLALQISKEKRYGYLLLKVFAFAAVLKKLVESETCTSVVLIMESTTNSEEAIRSGFSDQNTSLKILVSRFDDGMSEVLKALKKLDDPVHEYRDKIRNALNIKDEKAKDNLKKYLGHRLESTGKWLDCDIYSPIWSDWQAVVEPILALEAKPGFGKSVLCLTIIQNLSKRYPPKCPDPWVSVVYYFMAARHQGRRSC